MISGVTFDLEPLHLMDMRQFEQRSPKILVLYRLSFGVEPPIALPFLQPMLAEAIDKISAVAVQLHSAGLLQSRQSGDSCLQLHALIGGIGLASGQFFYPLPVNKDTAPAARSGIAGTGSVGVDDKLR